MKKLTLFLTLSIQWVIAQNFADYVKPLIGTGGHGHTYPGATTPYGMVQLSPDTRVDGSWDGCGGYHYSDKMIYGFSHTHLNGTGVSDYGDIMLMPVTSQPMAFSRGDYASKFSHEDEIAEAGFYSVKLLGNDVTVRLTSTPRTGFHQYIFHHHEHAMVVLNLNHRDELIDGEIEILDDHTVAGYRYSKAWARNQKTFFYIEFSKKIISSPALNDSIKLRGFKKINGKQLCANFFFDIKTNDTLLVKVGISGTSKEGAKLNLQTENPGWNFDKIKRQAKDLWNKELSKIQVMCDKRSDYEVFYTALYHTMVNPNLWNDVDGKYRGMDDNIYTKENGNYYTVFSLWDTFRAAHPLYTLIDHDRTRDYIETFIFQYQHSGRLPVWELAANETDCMIGIHSLSVIADAVSKGIIDSKYKSILSEAVNATAAMNSYRGIGVMNENHYLVIESESESVSKTLEYCYQYYCMSIISKWANREFDADKYLLISKGYRNLFNNEVGFFCPKENGNFISSFDPRQVNNHFTEANAWQYTFFVPHDISGLIDLYGGRDAFRTKLDSLFNTSSLITGREQADITGLIGQYAHGNEPSHHVAYLYNFVGDFKKSSKYVNKICNEFYSNQPDGLVGNEDCGQMSAWYVLSAMGLYQVCPGSPYFTFSIPTVLSASITLGNGKLFSIQRDRGEINQITWNGQPLPRLFLSYNEIMAGGLLRFESNDNQSSLTGIHEGDLLKTSTLGGVAYVAAPIIKLSDPVFLNDSRVEIVQEQNPAYYTMYRIQTGAKTVTRRYKKPFKVKANCTITAWTKNGFNGSQSPTTLAKAYRRPNNYTIEIKSSANPQYFPGGENGLLDGVLGDEDWRKGYWHGYQGQDFEAIIDLKKSQPIQQVNCRFLQDVKSWILMPTEIAVYGSEDGSSFKLIAGQAEAPDDKTEQVFIKTMGAEVGGKSYRFIKVVAKSYGNLPKWHPGAGNPSFIFIDEIEIK